MAKKKETGKFNLLLPVVWNIERCSTVNSEVSSPLIKGILGIPKTVFLLRYVITSNSSARLVASTNWTRLTLRRVFVLLHFIISIFSYSEKKTEKY